MTIEWAPDGAKCQVPVVKDEATRRSGACGLQAVVLCPISELPTAPRWLVCAGHVDEMFPQAKGFISGEADS